MNIGIIWTSSRFRLRSIANVLMVRTFHIGFQVVLIQSTLSLEFDGSRPQTRLQSDGVYK